MSSSYKMLHQLPCNAAPTFYYILLYFIGLIFCISICCNVFLVVLHHSFILSYDCPRAHLLFSLFFLYMITDMCGPIKGPYIKSLLYSAVLFASKQMKMVDGQEIVMLVGQRTASEGVRIFKLGAWESQQLGSDCHD